MTAYSCLIILTILLIPPLHSDNKKEKINRLLPILASLPIQSKIFERFSSAYKHSNLKNTRVSSDCKPDCPKVDIWQYAYKPVGKPNIIIDSKPISTRKAHWKTDSEARIIAVSLFGNNAIYLDGLIDFINSIDRLKRVNNIPHNDFGYSTFTIRAYVAKRKPQNEHLGKLQGVTNETFINKLIDLGVEIAYVDNHMKKVSLDATFWRFMIAAETMPKNHRIRYFVRDVDWFLSALDVYVLGDWISNKHYFHRLNIAPLCISPLVAGMWGGTHQGKSPFTELKNKIEYYPYRLQYGDDEVFLRDFVWEKIKASGSVLTHIIKKRNYLNRVIEPYKNSCEEPTSNFCQYYMADNSCTDRLIPKSISFSILSLSSRDPLSTVEDKYFYIDESDTKIKTAIQVLKAEATNDE